MSFSKLTGIGSECGPSNGLVDFMKQFGQDRSLQQDRYASSSKPTHSGFRSQTLSSPAASSDNLANEFFHQENLETHSNISSPFQYASPALSFSTPNDTWIQEFQLKNRISTTPPPLATYEEFEQHTYEEEQSQTSSQSPTLVQEFQQVITNEPEQLAFERAFEEITDEDDRDWDKEFADHEAWEAKARPIPTRSSSHMLDVKDWSVEFSKYDDLQALSRSLGEDDWVKKYQKSLENKKEWQRLTPNYGYRAIHPEYQKYDYMLDNPYLSHPDAIEQVPHTTLADEIMALEAKSQLNPDDAKTWEKLGLKQQENERDGAAITALEKAVSINAQCLDAWLALSVSYTNEHCRMDAYNCLEQWIAHNPKYKLSGTLGQNYTDEKKRHEYITQLFLEAARSSPEEMDPNVQVGLGVLFNMSEEYGKAVDCFKAALTSRPHDYQLWNKVGATLANSRDSLGAVQMYYNALEINPSFVRARYNLAISCMNMGHYQEAAEHLLTSLDLQRAAARSAGEAARALDKNTSIDIPNGTSDGIWDSLRLLMYMMSREDLAAECDHHNLDAFRGQFDF